MTEGEFQAKGYKNYSKLFTEEEFGILKEFTEYWIKFNIARSISDFTMISEWDLTKYHAIRDIKHQMVASSTYRYCIPPQDIASILTKDVLLDEVRNLSSSHDLVTWQDPGYGWLGYRIIRPGMNDGYPPSCKNWGAAAGVYSLWVPIMGCTTASTIRFLDGSHRKEYNKYIPSDTKFTKGECRLSDDIDPSAYTRPSTAPGDALIYHPNVIHSEDSNDLSTTRVNLEYRFMPKP